MLRSGCFGKIRLLLAAALMFPTLAAAHDIPNKMSIDGFARQQGNELHLLVRVPLVMLLNLNLPKEGAGFLALDHLEEHLPRAVAAVARDVRVEADGVRLDYETVRGRISPLSDQSFSDIDSAAELLSGPPLSTDAKVFWNQGYFDAHFIYEGVSDPGDVSVSFFVPPGLRNILSMNLVFVTPDGGSRAFLLDYDTDTVRLDPDWWRAAWDFGARGFWHIFDGIDHVLFLLCLVVPFRAHQLWTVVATVTCFTVAHSLTLSAGALGFAPQAPWFPPFIELAIAVSIIYMAVENFFNADPRWRWVAAGLFGLLHGYGFSFALQENLQFSGAHSALALLSYNVGIEVAQVLFVVIFVSAVELLPGSQSTRRHVVLLVSLLAGHVAWHWAEERFDTLSGTGVLEGDWLFNAGLIGILCIVTAAMLAPWVKRRADARGGREPG